MGFKTLQASSITVSGLSTNSKICENTTISIEEGSIGGFGSHVKNLLAEKGVFDKGLKFRAMTLPDIFIEQDNPKDMYELAGLNATQISKKITDVLFKKQSIKVVKNW